MADNALMLVFRDLITTPGDTIALHSEIITSSGYCWWGWWKKPIELVPIAAFEALELAKSPKNIFLFDSGQYLIYKGTLSEIFVAPSEDGMQSPDINRTPNYYVDLSLTVWFKLTQLERLRSKYQSE